MRTGNTFRIAFHASLLTFLFALPAFAQQRWERTYGGTGSDWGESVQQTQDGGYIVAGGYDCFGTDPQVYLIKTNAFGDTLWTRTYGGTSYDDGNSVKQTSDGGYIVAGYTTSFGNGTQVYLVKTNASGDTLWTKTYGGTGSEAGNSVQQTSDGGYIVAGDATSFGNAVQFYLIKTDPFGSSGVEDKAEIRGQRPEVRTTARPNPFTSFATIPGNELERFSLYDVSGRRVGTYRGDRIGQDLVAGVYFLMPFGGNAKPLRIVKVR